MSGAVWVLVAWLLVEAWRYNANQRAAANRREAQRLIAEARRAHRNLSLVAALQVEAVRNEEHLLLKQTALEALANGDERAEAIKRTTKETET